MGDKTFSIIGNDLVNDLVKVLEDKYPEIGAEIDKGNIDPYNNIYKTGQRNVVLYIKKWLDMREQRELNAKKKT